MVLKKCANCNKNITQKSPGLECSRCNKCVHATATCAKLSNKQLAALRNSDGLEWSCEECLRNMTKRSSFFLPDDSENEEERESEKSATFDSQKLLRDISREIRKVVKDELEELTTAINFMNSQISDLEDTVKEQGSTIKVLVNKNSELINKNKNLELRISAMEQRIQEVDQKLLASTLEIAGIPVTPNQNTLDVVKEVAAKLKVNPQQLVNVRRVPRRRKEQPDGPIIVELQSKGDRDQWLSSAKKNEILTGNILSDLPTEKATRRVYVRAALTHYSKTLLYNAKQRLNGTFKYIWCKEGKIYAKKGEESERVFIIRAESDIDSLLKS
ncbi:unnamed protein product [Arctia plantaginis]|uniref:Zinc finger DNA binding protein n=1 Tax=Arctia plantaginis TaxID=874455 RepID=A0A8S1B351_ARCPL|nr:unnamed protein product [Arctia plantaginis]